MVHELVENQLGSRACEHMGVVDHEEDLTGSRFVERGHQGLHRRRSCPRHAPSALEHLEELTEETCVIHDRLIGLVPENALLSAVIGVGKARQQAALSRPGWCCRHGERNEPTLLEHLRQARPVHRPQEGGAVPRRKRGHDGLLTAQPLAGSDLALAGASRGCPG